jgi:fluoride ion exporter CrcB/FEX
VSENLRLFVMVGLCGGYTTFSAFSLQTLDLMRGGALARAAINIVAYSLQVSSLTRSGEHGRSVECGGSPR